MLLGWAIATLGAPPTTQSQHSGPTLNLTLQSRFMYTRSTVLTLHLIPR
jgi:hypothetical protein